MNTTPSGAGVPSGATPRPDLWTIKRVDGLATLVDSNGETIASMDGSQAEAIVLAHNRAAAAAFQTQRAQEEEDQRIAVEFYKANPSAALFDLRRRLSVNAAAAPLKIAPEALVPRMAHPTTYGELAGLTPPQLFNRWLGDRTAQAFTTRAAFDGGLHVGRAMGCVPAAGSATPAAVPEADPAPHQAELEAALNDPDQVPYMIVFDDADKKPEMVIGATRARFRYKQISTSWNAHLFVKINSNSRDCTTPNGSEPAFSVEPRNHDELLRLVRMIANDGKDSPIADENCGQIVYEIDRALNVFLSTY